MKKTKNGGEKITSLTKKIGRPAGEPTGVIAFRVPLIRKDEIKKLLNKELKKIIN